MRPISEIIIHCSATHEGRDYTVADIDRWHRARGFRCIGYHYVIHLDGSIEQGRPIEQPGAHCKGHNQQSIGICYIGGLSHESHQRPDGTTETRLVAHDTRTHEQKDSLRSLLKQLQEELPQAKIYGHYHFAPKACPSFKVPDDL